MAGVAGTLCGMSCSTEGLDSDMGREEVEGIIRVALQWRQVTPRVMTPFESTEGLVGLPLVRGNFRTWLRYLNERLCRERLEYEKL